jgi:hypothetical protein
MRTLVLSAVLAFGPATLVFPQAQAVAPGPEYQRLEHFVGTWKVEGEQKPNPFGAPAGKFLGSETCSKFTGGFQVVCNLEGTIGGAPYREMATFGYDPEEKAYTWYDIDNNGWNGLAHGTVQGSTWTFLWQMKAGGKPLSFRMQLVEQSPTGTLIKGEFSLDGGPWVAVMDVVETKLAKSK